MKEIQVSQRWTSMSKNAYYYSTLLACIDEYICVRLTSVHLDNDAWPGRIFSFDDDNADSLFSIESGNCCLTLSWGGGGGGGGGR